MMAYGSSTGDNWSGGNAASYTVGGTVSGLSGTVVLQDNGGDDLSVSGERLVHVRHGAGRRRGYSVTVKTNPAGQTCTVSNGSGTVGSANVTNVAVSCASAASYTVGGTVSGLSGTVVLQDNGGDNLSVAANGPFTAELDCRRRRGDGDRLPAGDRDGRDDHRRHPHGGVVYQ